MSGEGKRKTKLVLSRIWIRQYVVMGEIGLVFSVRRAVRLLKLGLVFVVLTWLLYRLLAFGGVWFAQENKYREPSGKAVKVFQREAKVEEQWTVADRLKRFYRFGG
jgi:hypothetical protein